MITPTARAILLVALGAPVSLLLTVFHPETWLWGLGWAMVMIALIVGDAQLAGGGRRMVVRLHAPRASGIGAGAYQATVEIANAGRSVDVALEANPLVIVAPDYNVARFDGRGARATFQLTPRRRGEAHISRAFLRWRGPLGLAWRQRVAALDGVTAVTPDLAAIERVAERLFSRTFVHGLKPLRDLGDGSEFDALAKFEIGMDRRLIHWRQSARHQMLLAKEVRAERNHQLVFAIDTGRLMCEPVLAAPRVDWGLNAALMLAFVALKLGDRVSMFGFDAAPHLSTGFVSGIAAFEQLKLATARLDYSSQETNHTLAMAALGEKLQRRSLVVVFTEFTDAIGAELMLDTMARLVRKHVVLFVTFRDEELESLARIRPQTPEDVSRAVVASGLLRERELVLARLRRMGVQLVNAPVDQLGPALIVAYDALRRKERL